MKTVYLTLANGRQFRGVSAGAEGEAVAELVFTTSMGSYLETLTDACYYGQAVLQTFPLMGNYGVISEDLRGKKPTVAAYISREFCEEPSNFRSEGSIENYMRENGIIGVCGVDTREITKILRNEGTMNCIITENENLSSEQLERLSNHKITGAVEKTTVKQVQTHTPDQPKRRVVLWDFGESTSLVSELLKRDCEVVRVPGGFTAKQVLELSPDAIALSDGAGDPAENAEIIEEIKAAVNSGVPVFGLGLGHMMLALSQGGSTVKLKHGHRGASQPIIEKDTGRILIAGQNQGYAVKDVPKNARETYFNVNDKACEGLEYTDIPAYSLEFLPCDAIGPVDTKYIFDKFIELMDKAR